MVTCQLPPLPYPAPVTLSVFLPPSMYLTPSLRLSPPLSASHHLSLSSPLSLSLSLSHFLQALARVWHPRHGCLQPAAGSTGRPDSPASRRQRCGRCSCDWSGTVRD